MSERQDIGTYDYVIVGAGSSDCVMANRPSADLAKRGCCGFDRGGPARMAGYSPEEAMVYAELRVHGIRALRVADCSIMPGNSARKSG